MRISFILFMLIIAGSVCHAQPDIVKQDKQILGKTASLADKMRIYYAISRDYWYINTDSTIFYAERSLELARRLKLEKDIALALLSKGVGLTAKGKYPEALSCHLSCLSIAEKIKLPGLSGNADNNIGIVYMNIENYSLAQLYFTRALRLLKKQRNKPAPGELDLIVNLAEVFKKKNLIDSAIYYNNKALAIAGKTNNSLVTAIALFNLADNYIIINEDRKALGYLYAAASLSRRIGDSEGTTYCDNDFSLVYFHLRKYKRSKKYASRALKESLFLGIYEITRTSYKLLYLNNQQVANYRKALMYRNLEIRFSDSLNTITKSKQMNNIQSDFEVKIKDAQIRILKEEKKFQETELGKDKLGKIFGISFTALLIFIATLLYRSNKDKKKLNLLLVEQNREIRNQNQGLAELNETKNKLFSIIGHDLRAPFASLSATIGLIQDEALSGDEQSFFLSKISEGMAATDYLLNNLLYWAKSQMDGIVLNTTSFELCALIRQNFNLLQNRIHEKGVFLEIQPSCQLVFVRADQAMIDIIIRNLLDNALKYTIAGDTISVSLTINQNFVRLAVKDTGCGILAADQSRLFNKLNSFTTYGTNHEKGSGLGLLLCKDLIEKNGGAIGFESEPGKGSVFYITIPVDRGE